MENKFALTTDILIFSISSGEAEDCRKLTEKNFNILLVKRNKEPFNGNWCLPGGYVDIDENMESAADRILLKETNIKNIYKEQLYTFDDVKRDPRMRTISAAYIALVDKNKIKDDLSEDSDWFNIELVEDEDTIKVDLTNSEERISFSVKKLLADKTTNKYEYVTINSDLAFDHALIMITGILRLRHKARDTDIVFNLLPEHFTLGELQQVYELILNKKLLDPAFRRIISNKVEKTDGIRKTGGHRPSILFRYKED